jgi:colanic acid/amylovoran biosynthesis protein
LAKRPKLLVLDNLDAPTAKAVISQGHLVISSRYHGVVSALSQGVPALCTSWSHKYQELLAEYKMADCCLGLDNIDAAKAKIEYMLKNNREIRNGIVQNSSRLTAEKMWQEIISLCGLSCHTDHYECLAPNRRKLK